MSKRKQTRGERNVQWIEQYCRIPEGPEVGKPVKLREWQRHEILKIYDNPHKTRRAIISFGRKNAKTSLAAMLLLLHLVGREARRNSQLYSSAQSQKQAALIFKLAAKMIRMNPDLRGSIIVRDANKALVCPEIGTEYQALSAEVKTSFGLNPVFMVHDELGQVRGPKSELYDALETATGAQDDPLSVIISTQSATDADLLSVLIDDALARNDPQVVLSLYTAPAEDDPFSEATIKKANPAYGDFLNEKEVLAMARAAERMPSAEASYRNLVLNQRVQADNPFISESLFMSCGGPVDADWGNAPVFGGLDLSAVKDLTALVLMAKINDRWQVKPYFWIPADGLIERSRSDHVPYDVWHRKGHLETTPGKAIDYAHVSRRILDIVEPLNVKKIAFDRWNFAHLRPWLSAAGFSDTQIEGTFLEFGQGFKSMSPALRYLETLFLDGNIAHANHPVLKMCAGNAVVHVDPKENRTLDKIRSHGRIDGMVALAMAAAMAETARETGPKHYQIRVI